MPHLRKLVSCLVGTLAISSAIPTAQAASFPLDNLLPFYPNWKKIYDAYDGKIPPVSPNEAPTSPKPLPSLLPAMQTKAGVNLNAREMAYYVWYYTPTEAEPLFATIYTYPSVDCRSTKLFVYPPRVGAIEERQSAWEDLWCDSPSPPPKFTADRHEYGTVVRRKTLDGSEYDATSLKISRDGFDWVTYYFGYNLGFVAHESNWDPANETAAINLLGIFSAPKVEDDFELKSLPPPWVENEVTEYVNKREFPKQPQGQFFYAVRDDDKALLDSLPSWSRTGRAFKSGGYVSVCRFYGGLNGGPNTHFYSANAEECESLKQYAHLSYEGQTFAASMPMPPRTAAEMPPGALRGCPIDSKPLYRLYNAASTSNGQWVSNHRYTTDRFDVSDFVRLGWIDEGHVMCVPTQTN